MKWKYITFIIPPRCCFIMTLCLELYVILCRMKLCNTFTHRVKRFILYVDTKGRSVIFVVLNSKKTEFRCFNSISITLKNAHAQLNKNVLQFWMHLPMQLSKFTFRINYSNEVTIIYIILNHQLIWTIIWYCACAISTTIACLSYFESID